MKGRSQKLVGIWNLRQSYRKAQLSPGRALRSAMKLSMPRVLRRAARATALRTLERDQVYGWWAHALPPPMMRTGVSRVSSPSTDFPGAERRAWSSGWMSRLSSLVLMIQIFHWRTLLILTGQRSSLPLPLAAGEVVLKESETSMNCFYMSVTHQDIFTQLTRTGVAGINTGAPSSLNPSPRPLNFFVSKRLFATTPGPLNVRR